MTDRSYGIVILNYNSSDDCVKAVESIQQSATRMDYHICIVEGGSSKDGEYERLCESLSDVADIIDLGENRGYAYGNNVGSKYLIEQYSVDYIVIMNPDVIINQKGTVEGLIDYIVDADNHVIGAQPLVDNVGADIPANMQTNIRRCYSYSDLLVNSWWILRRLFKRKHYRTLYMDDRPYTRPILNEVSSGAFFIIDAEVFRQIGFLDEETFLYAEELILGVKVKQRKQCFVLVPDYIVSHYQGKTTGSRGTNSNKTARMRTMDAVSIYIRKYLHLGRFHIFIYRSIMWLDYYTECLETILLQIAGK